MKKLLLSFIVLASLVSCGKDNKVSSAGSYSITNPLVTGSSAGQSLTAMINNPASFGQGQVLNSSSNQTCGTKWGIFQYCYGSGGSSQTTGQTWAQVVAANPGITFYFYNSTVGTKAVANTSTNIAAKQAELVGILNAAISVEVNGPIYYVRTASAQHVIDTRYTIQMNPSGTATTNLTEYFSYAR